MLKLRVPPAPVMPGRLLRQRGIRMPVERTPATGQERRARLLAAVAVLTGLLANGPVQAQIPVPRLSVDNATATAGFFRLSWETGAESVELQEALSPGFLDSSTTYSGPDRSTVISGKPDGTWHYRVRASSNGHPGPWSEPVTVTVIHHHLGRALMFLALGFVVFAAVVLTILRGREDK